MATKKKYLLEVDGMHCKILLLPESLTARDYVYIHGIVQEFLISHNINDTECSVVLIEIAEQPIKTFTWHSALTEHI